MGTHPTAEVFHLHRLDSILAETVNALEEFPEPGPDLTSIELSEQAFAELGLLVHKLARRNETTRQLARLSETAVGTVAQVDLGIVVLHDVLSSLHAQLTFQRAAIAA